MKESVTSGSVTKDEEILKGISNFAKTIKVGSTGTSNELDSDNVVNNETTNTNINSASSFKVSSNTLPEKTNVWTKIKNALFYEIKVELTPYEQKIEDEINDFLFQDVTFKSFKGFLTQDIEVTYKGKKVF